MRASGCASAPRRPRRRPPEVALERPDRELAVDPAENARGLAELRAAEARDARELAALRERWWRARRYVYVTPGDALARQAVAGFPRAVRELCERAPLRRYDARGGGGFWPDANEIWFAAGVETYEGLAQVVLSARHELFHFVNWNDPLYRADLERGWPGMRAALGAARPVVRSHDRYATWLERSFVPQGDHANPVEYFADIPTNFPDAAELPSPLAAYFGPLMREGAPLPRIPRRSVAPIALSDFHALLLP